MPVEVRRSEDAEVKEEYDMFMHSILFPGYNFALGLGLGFDLVASMIDCGSKTDSGYGSEDVRM